MRTYPHRFASVTRRDAMRRLGAAGIGVVVAPGLTAARSPAPVQGASGSSVTFPEGAIIRTVLRDVDPEELAGGATLFHEHLSIGDPLPAWVTPPENPRPPFTADLDLMADEVNATAQEGVSCIVNGGTKDLGQNFERLVELAGG